MLIIMSCLLFQTAVALFLLTTIRLADDFEKNLQRILIILLLHVVTKYVLLTIVHHADSYSDMATGFDLLYGPLLYILTIPPIEHSHAPFKRQRLFAPFAVFSFLCLAFIFAKTRQIISPEIFGYYKEFYHGIVIASLVFYVIKIKSLLAVNDTEDAANFGKMKLVRYFLLILCSDVLINMAILFVIPFKPFFFTPPALEMLHFACFAFIPVVILQYKLQKKPVATVTVTIEGMEQETVVTQPIQKVTGVNQPADKKYQKSGLDDQILHGYEIKLVRFIEHSKIYLNSELSLNELSSQVNIPKHHITQLLNNTFNKNFYSFINEYRIGEAIAKLKDPSAEINILSLAYDCGFNSKSSFNNYFKKLTGQTPSYYRKTILNPEPANQLA